MKTLSYHKGLAPRVLLQMLGLFTLMAVAIASVVDTTPKGLVRRNLITNQHRKK